MTASATLAQAPARKATAVIVGAVSDSTLRPIDGADVSFAGYNLRTSSDPLGRFQVVNVPAGKFVLVVRRIGYNPIAEEIDVADGDTLRLAFTLESTAQQLSTFVITEKKLSPKLAEFEHRRKAGQGTFFNLEEIEKINPLTVGDILRRATSVRIQSTPPPGLGEIAVSSREVGTCAMQIIVDGVSLGQVDLTYLPRPSAIVAIEVYAGSAQLPVWVSQGQANTNRGCGAILIWTKDG
jgi:hypothetical protein